MPLGSEEFGRRMLDLGDTYRAAGVVAIYLVHGSFVGHDASGLLTELSRVLPGAGDALREISKRLVDSVVGEHGNYTPEFARRFQRSINRDDRRHIPVRLFHWSSENHHIGRADGAVHLLDELDRIVPPGRVLLWGHSHAGNVFALLTNLLAGDKDSVAAFFEKARSYYRRPTGRADLPLWDRVRSRLLERSEPAVERPLDFVTFGTPIRYGWDTNGYDHLLHVIHHRPKPAAADYLAPFPPSLEDVLSAAGGDCVQQIGIAGTNVMPGLMTWRTLWADRQLNHLLQPDLPIRQLQSRLKKGMRVPEEGFTLLVDYGPPQGNLAQHHAGHAVYTDPRRLLFHAEQTAAHFY